MKALAAVLAHRGAALAVFLAAAVLEVLGDALIRRGLRGSAAALVALGVVALGAYGVVVNLLPLDFSRLLGAYVGVFAATSVLVGRLVFGDAVAPATWLGLAVILAGSLIVGAGAGR